MKRVSCGFVCFIIITSLVLLLQEYSVAEELSNPAPAACNAWIESNHNLKYSNHGCQKYADILKAIEGTGGGVITIGTKRFFIVWFPDGWEIFDKETLTKLNEAIEMLEGVEGAACFLAWNLPALDITVSIADEAGLSFEQVRNQIYSAVCQHLAQADSLAARFNKRHGFPPDYPVSQADLDNQAAFEYGLEHGNQPF